ncbi:MAG: GerMN domain-containing protein [Clostridium sp.]
MKKKLFTLLATGLCAILLAGCVDISITPKKDAPTSQEENDKKEPPKEDTNKDKDNTNKEEPNTVTPPKKDDTTLKGDINVKLIYHESFSENNYYTTVTLKSKDKETLVKDIISKLKTLPDESYFAKLENKEFMPVPSDLNVNSVKIATDVVTVDFNKNFSTGLGSSGENNLLQTIVNSIGVNLGVDKVIITFNGKNYSSGHIEKKNGEGFTVSKKSPRELKK